MVASPYVIIVIPPYGGMVASSYGIIVIPSYGGMVASPYSIIVILPYGVMDRESTPYGHLTGISKIRRIRMVLKGLSIRLSWRH